MSNKIMSAVFADQSLKSTMKFVMIAIADNASDEKGREGICFPSIATLVTKCGLSQRAVINNIELLVRGGYLLKASRYRKSGGRSSNMYLAYPQENKAKLDDEFSSMFETISASDAEGLSAECAPLKTEINSAPDAEGGRGLSAPDAEGVSAPDAEAYIEPPYTNPQELLTITLGDKAAKKQKVPSCLDEAKAYANEIGLAEVEAEKFYDHFSANGWLVGKAKSKMQDWKASMRNWKRNQKSFTKQASVKPADDGFADFMSQTEHFENRSRNLGAQPAFSGNTYEGHLA